MNPKLENLVLFIRSAIAPAQIAELIELLQKEVSTVKPLDPEAAPKAEIAQASIAAPAGLSDILNEMEEAYSEKKFPPLSANEARQVRDAYPGFIERCNAFQGRHLVKILREKLK